MSRLQREAVSPNDIASRVWWATAFPGHPYGQPVNGTVESVPNITVDDLKSYTRRVLARDGLKIAVVGDIDAESVGTLLDRTFGALPAKAKLQPVAYAVPQGLGRRIVTQLDVPQSVVNFGGPGIARNDPDFMAAYIINHILGGGSFSSRLYREVREKRGLAYGVSDSLIWLNHASLLLGSTATRADATGQTIDIIEQEIRKLAAEGPTEEEFVEGEDLSERFVRPRPRHLEPDREPTGADAARRARHRLYRAPSCPDRCGDPGRRQTGGQALARPRSPRHRGRPPRGRQLDTGRRRRIAQPCRQAGTSAREPGISRNDIGAFACIRSGAPCPDNCPGFADAASRLHARLGARKALLNPPALRRTADDAMLVR